jgi:hypothetical protein
LNVTSGSTKKNVITFDSSGLETALNYLHERSPESLEKLISEPGNELAYVHHLWSDLAKVTIGEFWTEQLSRTSWSSELANNIKAVKAYLLNQEKKKWLNEVLRYLPKGHFFNTTVYLNAGYDSIVFGENIALNLNSDKFKLDKRESVYYLIHELAHAGYVRYHHLPELGKIKTKNELLNVIKFLTHLEGMGVISALRLRISESGLLDNDYKVLLNNSEKEKRVRHYFRLLREVENSSNNEVERLRSRVFEKMSGKETRLWYITGCHIAQEIEKNRGIETLRKLVEQGSEEFFNTYQELKDKGKSRI